MIMDDNYNYGSAITQSIWLKTVNVILTVLSHQYSGPILYGVVILLGKGKPENWSKYDKLTYESTYQKREHVKVQYHGWTWNWIDVLFLITQRKFYWKPIKSMWEIKWSLIPIHLYHQIMFLKHERK